MTSGLNSLHRASNFLLAYAVLTLLPAALTLRERARWSHIERTGAGAPHASARAACTSAHRGACAASTAGEGGHGHAKA